MKNNGQKRKIFDAVDLMGSTEIAEEGNGIVMLPLEAIKPFHDHPFRLYEGERLEDMVESVKEHGILNPVIVWKHEDGYEMLSGHNRQNAARLAGLEELPALVKTGLTEDEAYVYVIETNMMQRSFADLLPSEKAAVMAAHYDKVCCQGKRNDIIRELELMNGIQKKETCGHNGHRLKSRDIVAKEYGFSSRNAARYLRINYLIRPFKDMIDEGSLALLAAVDLSYLKEEEQHMIFEILDQQRLKMKPKMAAELRKQTGKLTEQMAMGILDTLTVNKSSKEGVVSLRIPNTVCKKYFEGFSAEQMTAVVERALAAWFEAEKREKHV
jgi:ParB family chromosome partitioning protein